MQFWYIIMWSIMIFMTYILCKSLRYDQLALLDFISWLRPWYSGKLLVHLNQHFMI
jgi:hypothetical protein